jgi:hypothetical protein
LTQPQDNRNGLRPTRYLQTYSSQRAKGLAPWKPRGADVKARLVGAQEILEDYRAQLPLTKRQILYIGIGRGLWVKPEEEKLYYALDRATRSGRIDWRTVRDDSAIAAVPPSFAGPGDFWQAVRASADAYSVDLLDGQSHGIEVWVEAAGMVPQIRRVAAPFGVAVYSSRGFDKNTPKFEAAARFAERPTLVLHIGDLDPHGLTIFDSAARDVEALARDMGAVHAPPVEFCRVAVTPEQVIAHGLEVLPFTPKQLKRRPLWPGDFDWDALGGTVQAEALDPAVLALLLREAITERMDTEAYDAAVARGEDERGEVQEQADALVDWFAEED